jgi:hypothetical protein
MAVSFLRRGRTCSWVAHRPPRSVVPGPAMAAGADLPHDLATFVIEDALDLEHGFWGCVASGATFRSLGRRRTPQGRAVIARHLPELDAAEERVNDVFFAWRAGRPTEVSDALDAMLDRWRSVPDGGELTTSWAMDRPAWRAGRRTRRTSRR